jgi:hypothetical protein
MEPPDLLRVPFERVLSFDATQEITQVWTDGDFYKFRVNTRTVKSEPHRRICIRRHSHLRARAQSCRH